MQPINGVTPQVLVQRGDPAAEPDLDRGPPSCFRPGTFQLELAPTLDAEYQARTGCGSAAACDRTSDHGPGRHAGAVGGARAGDRWLWAGFAMPGHHLAGRSCSWCPSTPSWPSPGARSTPSSDRPSRYGTRSGGPGVQLHRRVPRLFFGQGSFVGPIFLRTLGYVAIASVISLVIAYPGGLLRGPVRRPAQRPLPGPADRPVLDQLHDADAGLDRPAPDRRLRQPGPGRPPPHRASPSTGWAAGPPR